MASSSNEHMAVAQLLQQRIARSTHSCNLPPAPHTTSKQPPSYHTYDEEHLLRVYEAVVSKEMSTRLADEEFGVPRSTLQDRVFGRVALKARTGAKRLLSDNEESALSNFIIGCAAIGYAKSKKHSCNNEAYIIGQESRKCSRSNIKWLVGVTQEASSRDHIEAR